MMLTKILAGAATGAALFSGFVASRPSSFHVERSLEVSAPRERAAAQVADFHAWTAWSPWEKKDPEMTRTYSGAASGAGARYAWRGNSEVGEGRMTIERSEPSQIVVRLEFLKPFEGTSTATYTFVPTLRGTRVTWAMDGESGFLAKTIHLFVDVDSMLGAELEHGLAALKVAVESDTTTAASSSARAAN